MEPFISMIIHIPYTSRIPKGWKMCTGELLAINQYPALYSLIGTQFGGNGISHFQLPNLMPEIVRADGTKAKRPFGEGDLLPIIAVQGLFPEHD